MQRFASEGTGGRIPVGREALMPPGRLGRIVMLGLGVVLIATACSKSQTPGTTKPIVIGISLSSSGDFSDPSAAANKGYELWAQTANARGGIMGRRVQLKIVDDTSSPDQVVTNYQNLITKDKVDF